MKTWESKKNKGYTVIEDAPDAVLDYVNSKPRCGKVQVNGLVIINTTAWIELQANLKKQEQQDCIINVVETDDELRVEANKLNDSRAGKDIKTYWSFKSFNYTFAGKTVQEANEMIEERGIEILFSESRKQTGEVERAVENFKEAQKQFSQNQGSPRYDRWGNRIA